MHRFGERDIGLRIDEQIGLEDIPTRLCPSALSPTCLTRRGFFDQTRICRSTLYYLYFRWNDGFAFGVIPLDIYFGEITTPDGSLPLAPAPLMSVESTAQASLCRSPLSPSIATLSPVLPCHVGSVESFTPASLRCSLMSLKRRSYRNSCCPP
jgi:hypothetical protein